MSSLMSNVRLVRSARGFFGFCRGARIVGWGKWSELLCGGGNASARDGSYPAKVLGIIVA